MRRFMLLIAVLAALVPVAKASARCASTEDRMSADLLALRNRMIVAAMSCGLQSEYNHRFVLRFRPVLQANDRSVTDYFRRFHGGEHFESAKDAFITDMVNAMSQEASRSNGGFCAHAYQMIDEMNAIRSMDHLASYAMRKDLSPPGVHLCAVDGHQRRW